MFWGLTIKEKIEKILRENSDIWKSESAYFNYLRGCIRLAWMRNPVKLKFLAKHKKQVPNPNYGKPRNTKQTVLGATCEICLSDYPLKEVEVDHKEGGNYSLRSIEDIQGFFESICIVSEDDLRIVCKGCHGCLSYAAKMGISFTEAKVIKEIIELQKTGKDVGKLLQLGVTKDNIPTTKDKRRKLLEELMLRS